MLTSRFLPLISQPDSPTLFIMKGGSLHQQLLELNNYVITPIGDRLRYNANIELITPQTLDIERIVAGEAVLVEFEGNYTTIRLYYSTNCYSLLPH